MYRAGDTLAVYTHSHTRQKRVNTNINCTKVNTHTSGVHSYVIMQRRCKHMCSRRQMRLCTCVHIQTGASSLVYLQMQVCQCLYTQTRISTQTCTQTCLCTHMLTTNLPQCKDTTLKKKEHIVLHKYMLNSLNKTPLLTQPQPSPPRHIIPDLTQAFVPAMSAAISASGARVSLILDKLPISG